MDLHVDIIGDRNALRNVDQLPDTVREIMLDKVKRWTGELRDLVEQNILDRLDQKTGKLLGGLDSEVIEDGNRVEGRVFIDGVPYARALEDGASIPAHIIRPRNAKLLAFYAASGDKVFATRVFHPGATLRPFNFAKDAYREKGAEISRGIKKAIVEGIRAKMRSSS